MAAPFVESRRTKKTANGKNGPTIRQTDVFRSTTIAIQEETESTILQSYLQKASILLTKKTCYTTQNVHFICIYKRKAVSLGRQISVGHNLHIIYPS